MKKDLLIPLVASLWFVLGYLCHEPDIVYKVVIQPATDQQLIDFWFGNQDKTKLRNRICRNR